MTAHRSIGIFGGTFDPIHFGHLYIAEVAREQMGLETVYFVPAGVPPHKTHKRITPAHHRLAMTLLGTISNPDFRVSDVEIKQEGPAYTFQTLARFKSLTGPDTELYFIVGADSLVDLSNWCRPEEVLRQSRIVAVSRPGFNLNDAGRFLGHLWERFAERIHLVEIEGLAISSTLIRKRVREGKSIRYLLPETVRRYVYKHRLYSGI